MKIEKNLQLRKYGKDIIFIIIYIDYFYYVKISIINHWNTVSKFFKICVCKKNKKIKYVYVVHIHLCAQVTSDSLWLHGL